MIFPHKLFISGECFYLGTWFCSQCFYLTVCMFQSSFVVEFHPVIEKFYKYYKEHETKSAINNNENL